MKDWHIPALMALALLLLWRREPVEPKKKEEAPLDRPLYPDELPGYIGIPIRRDREGNIIAW